MMEPDNTVPETRDTAPAPAAPVVTETPKRDWLLRFNVGGFAFVFRRPSRADVSMCMRLFVAKISSGDAALLSLFDQWALWLECILEVGLAPRTIRGEVVDLGELAPPHWHRGGAICFADVSVEEFEAVGTFLAANGVNTTMPASGPAAVAAA